MNLKPLVSCIIPTKNSEEFLFECLKSLKSQTYSPIEIIVVDNFSTDLTKKIADYYGVPFYQFGTERATQDNFGVLQSKGKYIYLSGSDMTRDLDFVEQAVEKLEQGYDALYMSVLTDRNIKHYWGKVKALERLTYIGDNTIESARFFRKDVFTALGGFDIELVQVEEDFQHRLDSNGYKTGRINAREYHLHEEENLGQVFKKSFYYGKFMRHYLKKHKTRGIKQLQPLRSSFFRNWRLFLKQPLLTIGFIIYKIVQYTSGLMGMYAKR